MDTDKVDGDLKLESYAVDTRRTLWRHLKDLAVLTGADLAADPEGKIRFAYDPAIATSTQGEQPSTLPPDLWPLWDALAVMPVLVLRGGHSDLLAAATVSEMGRRHSGPFTAVEVPGRGHAPILDEPAALMALEPFLQTWAV